MNLGPHVVASRVEQRYTSAPVRQTSARSGHSADRRHRETREPDGGDRATRGSGRERGRTVHGEAANAGHRVLAPDDAEVEAYLEQALHAAPPQRVEAEAPEQPDTVVVLDFGSQFAQLIARRVRELNVYSELLPHDTPMAELERRGAKAVILSGGPSSVYDTDAPRADPALWSGRIPVLGICYGLQLMAHELGGEVVSSTKREYGPATVNVTDGDGLLAGIDRVQPVWMSHGDSILRPPSGFRPIAQTDSTPFAGLADPSRNLYGIQFHPEVVHTPVGRDVLRNFVVGIAGVPAELDGREPRRDDRGRDPRTGRDRPRHLRALRRGGLRGRGNAGAPGHRRAADLHLRQQRAHAQARVELLRVTFERDLGMKLVTVDARDRFLKRLAGVEDPEEKRRIIGDEFIRVFEEEATKLGQIDFLAQGTLYPDVIESKTSETKTSQKIKTHHNVGGLPADMRFQLIEPLRYLFKDEVRRVGEELGLPEEMV